MTALLRVAVMAVWGAALGLVTPALAVTPDVCCQYMKPDACAAPTKAGCGKATAVSGATCVDGKRCVVGASGATGPTGQGKR